MQFLVDLRRRSLLHFRIYGKIVPAERFSYQIPGSHFNRYRKHGLHKNGAYDFFGLFVRKVLADNIKQLSR